MTCYGKTAGGKRAIVRTFALLITGLFLVSTASVAEVVTLRWATWGPELIDRQLIERFEQEHPNIRIEYIATPYGDHHERMKILMASGVGPDIVAVDGYYLVEFVTQNLLRPIDDLLAQDTAIDLDVYFPASLLDVRYNDVTYGLPYISGPPYLIYNVDLFRESGLSEPSLSWDWAAFEETAQALTRVQDGVVTRNGSTTFLHWGYLWPWVWSAGGRVFDASHERFLLLEPEGLEALNWLSDLEQRGITGDGNFARETAAFDRQYPGSLPYATGVEYPFEWDIAMWPAGPGGQYTIWKGNVMAITRGTEHLEEAWTFLKFLLGPNSQGFKIYVQNGRFLPLTRDRELWDLWAARGKQQTRLQEVTLRVSTEQHSRALPQLLQWNAIVEGTLQSALQRIRSGNVSPRVAMEEVKDVIESLLKNEPR